jgi:hypothetical protein
MWQSEVIREWKMAGYREGQLKGRRCSLLLVLRERFQTEVPADLAQRIEQTTDLKVLSDWFIAAVRTPSLDAFRGAIQAAVENS